MSSPCLTPRFARSLAAALLGSLALCTAVDAAPPEGSGDGSIFIQAASKNAFVTIPVNPDGSFAYSGSNLTDPNLADFNIDIEVVGDTDTGFTHRTTILKAPGEFEETSVSITVPLTEHDENWESRAELSGDVRDTGGTAGATLGSSSFEPALQRTFSNHTNYEFNFTGIGPPTSALGMGPLGPGPFPPYDSGWRALSNPDNLGLERAQWNTGFLELRFTLTPGDTLAAEGGYWIRPNSNVDPECSDGKDNDGDGKTDYPKDKGCDSEDDNDEAGPFQCSDGKDNDGDGLVDFPADPGCDDARDDDERQPLEPGSGLNNRVHLTFDSSFTGSDLLTTSAGARPRFRIIKLRGSNGREKHEALEVKIGKGQTDAFVDFPFGLGDAEVSAIFGQGEKSRQRIVGSSVGGELYWPGAGNMRHSAIVAVFRQADGSDEAAFYRDGVQVGPTARGIGHGPWKMVLRRDCPRAATAADGKRAVALCEFLGEIKETRSDTWISLGSTSVQVDTAVAMELGFGIANAKKGQTFQLADVQLIGDVLTAPETAIIEKLREALTLENQANELLKRKDANKEPDPDYVGAVLKLQDSIECLGEREGEPGDDDVEYSGGLFDALDDAVGAGGLRSPEIAIELKRLLQSALDADIQALERIDTPEERTPSNARKAAQRLARKKKTRSGRKKKLGAIKQKADALQLLTLGFNLEEF